MNTHIPEFSFCGKHHKSKGVCYSPGVLLIHLKKKSILVDIAALKYPENFSELYR